MNQKRLKIDSMPVNGANINLIKDWLQRLDIPVMSSILLENPDVMNESGIMKGIGVIGLGSGSSGQRCFQKKKKKIA